MSGWPIRAVADYRAPSEADFAESADATLGQHPATTDADADNLLELGNEMRAGHGWRTGSLDFLDVYFDAQRQS